MNQIRNRLTAFEFVLHYQPELIMSTREVMGAKAIIRWQRPNRVFLPPVIFLSVLEDQPTPTQVELNSEAVVRTYGPAS